MRELLKNKKLILHHVPGKGAWTYHIVIPNTADIEGTWGSLKVSGMIDDYELKEMNLAPRKHEDKIISINKEIRKSIGKTGGDTVSVILFLHSHDSGSTKSDVIKCFEDAEVLKSFKSLSKEGQEEIISDITSKKTEAKQIERITHHINQLLD